MRPWDRGVSMSLRMRVLLTSAVVVVVGALLAAAVGSWIVLRGFRDLEQTRAERDLDRAEAAIDADLANLAALARDWSARDDTLAYITSPLGSTDYLESNLHIGTFTGFGLDVAVLTELSTEVRHASAVDPTSGQWADPAPLVERLRGAGLLRPFGVLDDHRTGLIRVGDRLLAVSVRPITDTGSDVPPAGTLVLGRWMDDDVAATIAERTRVDLALDTSAAEIVGTRIETTPTTITIARTLRGIAGEPVVMLSATQPRSVLAQGRTSVRLLVLVVIGVLIGSGLVLLVIVDRQVLRRLRRLGREIVGVGSHSDDRSRVSVDGPGDEVDEVAVALNESLAALERAHEDLQDRNTELQQANVELEVANRRLDAVNRERRRFLSAVSHDLRTPLTSVSGFATLLRQRWDALPDEQRRHLLERIEASASTMDGMVADLLTLSRLEQGAMPAEPVRLDLRDFLPEVVADLPVDGVEVSAAAGVVRADPDHLRRILANLVDNAGKYGAPPIEVGAQVEGDDVVVRVRDHGPGVERDFEEVLFEAFSQADPERGTDAGVGLGLSIVQHLTTQNGGTVAYDNGVEPGACFVVQLPRVAVTVGTGADRT